VCVRVCVCACVCERECVCLCVCARMFVCVYVYKYVCMSVCQIFSSYHWVSRTIFVYELANADCMCNYTCMYMYVYTLSHTITHTPTNTPTHTPTHPHTYTHTLRIEYCYCVLTHLLFGTQLLARMLQTMLKWIEVMPTLGQWVEVYISDSYTNTHKCIHTHTHTQKRTNAHMYVITYMCIYLYLHMAQPALEGEFSRFNHV